MEIKDILTEQIKTIKGSLTSVYKKAIIPVVCFPFIIAAIVSQKEKETFIALTIVLLALFVFTAIYIIKRAKILNELKKITDLGICKKVIEAERIEFLIQSSFNRHDGYIIAVVFLDSNNTQYVYVLTDVVIDTLEAREFITSNLDSQKLCVYCYKNTNLIMDVENFPLNINSESRFPQKNIVHSKRKKPR